MDSTGLLNLVSWLYEVPGMEPRVASLDRITRYRCNLCTLLTLHMYYTYTHVNDRHTCQVCTKRACALKPRYANKCSSDENVLKLEPPSLSRCRCLRCWLSAFGLASEAFGQACLDLVALSTADKLLITLAFWPA